MSVGVSYNTAWLKKHKIFHVMKEQDDSRPLDGLVQIDEAYWGGERHGGKGGRCAPGKTPFVVAVASNPDGRPMHFRLLRTGRSDVGRGLGPALPG
ncbi:hypothetical protein Y981_08705 [Leptospirillum ferriphilum YSK]|uniref:ISXO2-like transposase domain-containing protein n=1 Tax=Leptospirillum ferriphilum YSK TaxID=1441628 RepID=A0A059XY81_9BACT|nr:hypothetical protein Y981_08705 [Leptospirillum ferriphilum YSK]